MRGRFHDIMHMCGEVEVAEGVTLRGGCYDSDKFRDILSRAREVG